MFSKLKWIFLVAVTFCFGCNHQHVSIDKSVSQLLPRLNQEGSVKYGKVLDLLGPPARIQKYGEGFLFVYTSYTSDEKELRIAYGQYGMQGKFDYATGNYYEQVVVLYFKDTGELLRYGIKEGRTKHGWGTSVGPVLGGVDLLANPFYEQYDYYNQKHVSPSSVANKAQSRGGPPHRKYMGEVETFPKIDQALSKSSQKREKHFAVPYSIIPIHSPVESLELSKFRWTVLKPEGEKIPFETLVPHVPKEQ